MKKNKIFLLSLLSSSVLSLALVITSFNVNSDISAHADNVSYGITFSSTNNKFFAGTGASPQSGDATVHTDLGNDVGFTYYNVAGGSSSMWHLVTPSGYFYNTTPILGLNKISIMSAQAGRSYKLYWSKDTNFDELNSETFTTDTSYVDFDFNDFLPKYFKFENIDSNNVSIKNMDIKLSCVNNYPYIALLKNDDAMGTVTGEGAKTTGEEVTIVATPNQGYRFIGWYADDVLISTNSTYTFNIGNDDLVYTAHFTHQSYNFVVQSESNEKGTVSDSSGEYNYLSNVSVEATANTGYSFSGWYRGNSFVSNSNPYLFSMPYNDLTLTAKFSANPYHLTLVNANSDLGSVTGAGTYTYGSSVTVNATPNTGVSFLGWYNENDELIASSNQYQFNMPYEDITLTARFAWTQYSVVATPNDGNLGTATGSGSYIMNQQVNLTATPNEHCSFMGWYIDDELQSIDTLYTFNMPCSNLEIEARFTPNYAIMAYSDNESMGTVIAPSEWGAGLEVTVGVNPNEGCVLDYWADENYDILSYDASYTFIMPNHDIELIAVFGTGYTLTVTSSDEAKGTVIGGGQYVVGRNVTVTMNYISGIFMGWFDGNNQLVATNNSYTFSMPSNDYSLEARFMSQQEWNIAHGVTPTISSDEKTITYGLYPQTNVNNPSLISALNGLTNPESNGWYLYGNEYYAKVNATPYSSSYKFDNGTTIVRGTTYWFKCEPITWNVLSNSNGKYYILSSVLLDAHRYNKYYSGTEDGHYANNYKYSEIRNWLNADFYNSAFALNNSYIQTTNVDNAASTTNSSTNQYACENTQDKVFMPSYQDYNNSSFGFSSSSSRQCRTTDWARARGSYYCSNNSSYYYDGWYWTRSPSSDVSHYAWSVGHDGYFSRSSVYDADSSVRPSLTIHIA